MIDKLIILLFIFFFQSESVGLTFYNLQWFCASNEIKLMLKFVIMRSQKAFCVKALSFGEMSLATFMAVTEYFV